MRTGWGLAAAIVFVGCSGAPSSDLFATTDQEATSPSAASTAPSASSTSSGPAPSASNDPTSGGATDSGAGDNSSDAGSTGTTDGGNGSTCTAAETEVEPNDSFVTANAMTDSKYCGAINPLTDTDFASFVLAKTAKTVSVDYNATDKISIQVTTQGTTVEITGTSPPPIPTNPGDEYYIQVKGVAGSKPAYVITVKQ